MYELKVDLLPNKNKPQTASAKFLFFAKWAKQKRNTKRFARQLLIRTLIHQEYLTNKPSPFKKIA